MSKAKRRCKYLHCKKGSHGRRGVVGPDRRADCDYCEPDCRRRQWELDHPERVVSRAGTGKASYNASKRRRCRTKKRRPRYRVGLDLEDETLWIGWARAHDTEQAKRKVLGRTLDTISGPFVVVAERHLASA